MYIIKRYGIALAFRIKKFNAIYYRKYNEAVFMLIFPNICYELGKIELRQRFNQMNIERKLLSSMIKKYGIYILLELSELMN